MSTEGAQNALENNEETISEATQETSSPAATVSKTVLYGIAGAVAVVGIVIGFLTGFFIRENQISELEGNLAAAEERVKLEMQSADDAWEGARQAIRDERASIDEELAERAAALDELEAELDETAKELNEREASVSAAEVEKSEREFGGGLHTVGKTVSPGTYMTNVTSGFCYYAWKNGTASGAGIIDNNIVEEGPATVTLRDGEVFESSGCGTWTRQ